MSRSKKLYNSDLAPTPSSQKKWGWFEIFNVWANDVQSLFGYTLAASLFIAFKFGNCVDNCLSSDVNGGNNYPITRG